MMRMDPLSGQKQDQKLKTMDGRTIPTRLELVPAEEPGNKTIVDIKDIKFNVQIAESFFSQQNMKNVR